MTQLDAPLVPHRAPMEHEPRPDPAQYGRDDLELQARSGTVAAPPRLTTSGAAEA
jgi:hypothetical protein